MTWHDRSGKPLGLLWDRGRYSVGRLSPDGARLAVSRGDPRTGKLDMWLVDLDRSIPTRFTSDPTDESHPVWSPDGSRIVFSSNRNGRTDLYERASSGLGSDELLYRSPDDKMPTGFSPDGRLLLFAQRSESSESLWALPMTGERVPFRLFPEASSSDTAGTFSPDGRWVAYHSSDGGRQEVYVQPYPRSPESRKTRLSTSSGYWPVWSRDGRQVIYSTTDYQYMAVDVDGTGGTLRAGLPQKLFQLPQPKLNHHFTFDPATGRFMLHTVSDAASTSIPITVVLNWASDQQVAPAVGLGAAQATPSSSAAGSSSRAIGARPGSSP